MHTMTMKGGNTDQLYKGDGRLTMARSLERVCLMMLSTFWDGRQSSESRTCLEIGVFSKSDCFSHELGSSSNF